jgi:hypothetical protein
MIPIRIKQKHKLKQKQNKKQKNIQDLKKLSRKILVFKYKTYTRIIQTNK